MMSDFASIDWQKDSSNTQEAAIDQMHLIFTRGLHLLRNYIIATSVVANPGIFFESDVLGSSKPLSISSAFFAASRLKDLVQGMKTFAGFSDSSNYVYIYTAA